MKNESFYSKYKSSTQKQLNSAFCQACSNGNLDEVKYLLTSPELKEHAEIHYYEDDALAEACWNGHLEIVKYLLTSPDLKEHSNLNDHENNNCDGLLNACGAGHLEIVKYLLTSSDLQEHALINCKFMPPLGSACEEGYFDIVKYLLTSPNLKEKAELNNSALVSAISRDRLEILKYLLNDPDLPRTYNIHANEDVLFGRGIYQDARDCIKYLIFDFNIEITDNIKKLLENPTPITEKFINEIKMMITARELSEELENNGSNTLNKKRKL
jgi:ankyrin repeat protein